ncbi:hypothetical protein ACIGEL_18120 [Rossellomorea aquimaris]|uniref:hypothetical protein n=1 Tax=Rossellomorea aquimaris TaxID=189382 RepID=UPI0037C5B371
MSQHNSEKQNLVQDLYRKKKREKSSHKLWAVILILCVIPVLILLVTSALFDLGVPLPEFFGR